MTHPCLLQVEVLYEVDANSENWMIAGRKRGHVSLSTKQGISKSSNVYDKSNSITIVI